MTERTSMMSVLITLQVCHVLTICLSKFINDTSYEYILANVSSCLLTRQVIIVPFVSIAQANFKCSHIWTS